MVGRLDVISMQRGRLRGIYGAGLATSLGLGTREGLIGLRITGATSFGRKTFGRTAFGLKQHLRRLDEHHLTMTFGQAPI